MKKLLLLIVCVSSVLSCITATKIPLESPPPKIASFENGLSLSENYIKANEWMVETFNDPGSVIQFTDKESGIVKGKYVMLNDESNTFYAIITLRVKDNAYRIEIDPPSGMYSVTIYEDSPFLDAKAVTGAGFTP
jgi:hypothetical protein